MANEVVNHWTCDGCDADMGTTQPTVVVISRPTGKLKQLDLCHTCWQALKTSINLILDD